jgi:hypothetical protein
MAQSNRVKSLALDSDTEERAALVVLCGVVVAHDAETAEGTLQGTLGKINFHYTGGVLEMGRAVTLVGRWELLNDKPLFSTIAVDLMAREREIRRVLLAYALDVLRVAQDQRPDSMLLSMAPGGTSEISAPATWAEDLLLMDEMGIMRLQTE